MHPSITKFAVRFSKSALVQSIIQRIVFSQFLNYLIGIGAGSSVFSSGEKIVFKILKDICPSDKPICIFDVGANQGQFISMTHKNLHNIPLNIHSFEPSKPTYKLLKESTKECDYSSLKLNNFALGEKPGESTLYYDTPGSWLASLSRRNMDYCEEIDFKHSEAIKIDTLDNYCLNTNVQEIHLLKLDVEGHEIDVLQGAQKMLESQKVKMILFEFGSANIDSRTFFQDIFYFLKNYGINNIFRITPSEYLSPVEDYKVVYEQFRCTNFIALSKEVSEYGFS